MLPQPERKGKVSQGLVQTASAQPQSLKQALVLDRWIKMLQNSHTWLGYS